MWILVVYNVSVSIFLDISAMHRGSGFGVCAQAMLGVLIYSLSSAAAPRKDLEQESVKVTMLNHADAQRLLMQTVTKPAYLKTS